MARRKTKKVFSRRSHASYANAPTTSFEAFKDYARTEIDKKETAKIIKEYVRKNFSRKEAKVMLSAPDYHFTRPYYVASTIQWKNFGYEFPDNWNHQKLFDRYFYSIKVAGEEALAEKAEAPPTVIYTKSIQDIVKENTSEFIANVEGVLDEFYNGTWVDVENYSPFLELKKIDAPYNLAKGVYDYYTPLHEEVKELIEKKPKDLVEAYSTFSAKRLSDYKKLLDVIITDIEKYMLTKKAVRQTRVSKPKTADKQIKNLKFLPESNEYKASSLNPMKIIGAMRLYTFNTKNRVLTEFVSNAKKGFEVKGSTLQNVDMELSRETKLRKPDEFLPIIMKQSAKKIDTEWKKLTTKTNTPNSRINSSVLLLRTMDK